MLVINIFQRDSHRRGASDNGDIPAFSGGPQGFLAKAHNKPVWRFRYRFH
jgi:hypothetical protein